MKINYYNSVQISGTKQEQSVSASAGNALNKWGDSLIGSARGALGGRSYIVDLNTSEVKENPAQSTGKPTMKQKICGAAGFSFKFIAAALNKEIKQAHEKIANPTQKQALNVKVVMAGGDMDGFLACMECCVACCGAFGVK